MQTQAHTSILQFGTFLLGNEEYAVDLLRIREILRMQPVTRVPRAEDFVEGAINIRGAVIPLVNMRKRFQMAGKPFDSDTRIMNIETGDIVIGFVVDKVGRVRSVPAESVEPAPPVIAGGVDSEYISGICNIDGQLLIILDVDKLLAPETLEALAGI